MQTLLWPLRGSGAGGDPGGSSEWQAGLCAWEAGKSAVNSEESGHVWANTGEAA